MVSLSRSNRIKARGRIRGADGRFLPKTESLNAPTGWLESIPAPDIGYPPGPDGGEDTAPVTEPNTEVYRTRYVDMSSPTKRKVYGEASLRGNPCACIHCEFDQGNHYQARTAFGISEKTPWGNMKTGADVRGTMLRFCSYSCLARWKASNPDNNRARNISPPAVRVLLSARTGMLPADRRTPAQIRERRTRRRTRSRARAGNQ
jgi:hypothetical protein